MNIVNTSMQVLWRNVWNVPSKHLFWLHFYRFLLSFWKMGKCWLLEFAVCACKIFNRSLLLQMEILFFPSSEKQKSFLLLLLRTTEDYLLYKYVKHTFQDYVKIFWEQKNSSIKISCWCLFEIPFQILFR